MKAEFLNHNSKPSYALMSTISGHDTHLNQLIIVASIVCLNVREVRQGQDSVVI